MSIAKSYTFTNNTIIDPDEVNQNFDDVIDAIQAAHHRDGDGTKISYEDIASGWGLVPSGGILLWSGLISAIPTGYYFCNGSNGTPDLRNKFALCPGQDSGGTYDTGDTGGEVNHTLSESEMPAHNHGGGNHTHSWNYKSVNEAGSGHREANSTGGDGTDNTNASGTIISTQGGGAAHNNMPPYKAIVHMMKS